MDARETYKNEFLEREYIQNKFYDYYMYNIRKNMQGLYVTAIAEYHDIDIAMPTENLTKFYRPSKNIVYICQSQTKKNTQVESEVMSEVEEG
jgi:hypothetical protein